MMACATDFRPDSMSMRRRNRPKIRARPDNVRTPRSVRLSGAFSAVHSLYRRELSLSALAFSELSRELRADRTKGSGTNRIPEPHHYRPPNSSSMGTLTAERSVPYSDKLRRFCREDSCITNPFKLADPRTMARRPPSPGSGDDVRPGPRSCVQRPRRIFVAGSNPSENP